jgi:hypothetical protein
MSTNLQKDKRRTRHVRVEIGLHLHMKVVAINRGITMTELFDELCRQYLSQNEFKQENEPVNIQNRPSEVIN